MDAEALQIKKLEWLQRLQDLGAFWEYRGGRLVPQLVLGGQVSDFYFNSTVLLSEPSLTRSFCREVLVPELLARELAPSFVLTVAPYGLSLGTILAAEIGARLGYCSARGDDRPSRIPGERERSIVVTDDIWSGGSVRRLLKALRDTGRIDPSLILVLGNCSELTEIAGVSISALFCRKPNLWRFEESPYALLQGVAAVPARESWEQLQLDALQSEIKRG